MIHGGRRAALLLFLGDLSIFVLSLLLTLMVRYGSLFDADTFKEHLGPFSVLFAIWGLVFYMSGLYGKRILLRQSSLADAIVKTQLFNVILAALFFFLFPGIGIAPKTNLLVYLIISMTLIMVWRLGFYPRISLPRARASALLIADSEESHELLNEVNRNTRYNLKFELIKKPSDLASLSVDKLSEEMREKKIHIIVTDLNEEESERVIPPLYTLPWYTKVPQLLSFSEVYEDVFDRIPLSQLRPAWFMQYASTETPLLYACAKRAIDIMGGLLMGFITVVAAPCVWIANLFEGKGALFITQDRMGKNGTQVQTLKFRSMQKNDGGAWSGETENKITRVGAFLRRTSLDEFPQFWNVVRGDISLIGPRNDVVVLGERLAKALPNYNFRYAVRPGITGWAQINQQYEQGNISPQSIEETKMRLAYDFYYLKHRSLGLDIVIALKTIKRMFFRVSSW